MRCYRLKIDLAACAFLVVGLLIVLSLLGQDVKGPEEPSNLDAAAESNFLGWPGAWLAYAVTESLGFTFYVVIASWFILVIMMFQRRAVFRWIRRLFGWMLLIPCSAIAADQFCSAWPMAPASGGGGALGAWLSDFMRTELPVAARWSLLFGCSLLGLCLALDVLIVAMARIASKLGVILGPPLHQCRCAGRFLWRLSGRWQWRKIAKDRSPRNFTARRGRQSGAGNADNLGGDIPIRHHDQSQEALVKEIGPPKLPTILPRTVPIRRPTALPEADDQFADYELPPLSILEEPAPFPYAEHDQRLRERAALLEKTFADFDLNIGVVGINTGPVITQYEVALETGLRVHKVTNMSDDLALNLKVPSVRIVAPIPGKNTVGIEVPNEHRAVVRLKEVILTANKKAARAKIPLLLGKDTEGRPLVYDLSEMPHLLIAGRTGTGKSVCMNAIILSILMTRRPNEVKMIMIDTKMLELSE